MSARDTPFVSLRDVSKTFANGTPALANLDLEVRPGEIAVLLGPSGCGKSTALRLIAGLMRPSRGRIERNTGADEIGFVFQEPTLMPWANVRANVALPLRLKRMPRRDIGPRVAEALDMVGLAGFAESYPRELSGGMRMRVSIARALVTRPRLLLMDEPFAALDEITRFRLNDDLLRLRAGGNLTVVFVTHSVFEAVYLASRVLVVTARPGRIAAEIPIPPYARNEEFRTSPDYAACCRRASQALRAAMEPEPAEPHAASRRAGSPQASAPRAPA